MVQQESLITRREFGYKLGGVLAGLAFYTLPAQEQGASLLPDVPRELRHGPIYLCLVSTESVQEMQILTRGLAQEWLVMNRLPISDLQRLESVAAGWIQTLNGMGRISSRIDQISVPVFEEQDLRKGRAVLATTLELQLIEQEDVRLIFQYIDTAASFGPVMARRVLQDALGLYGNRCAFSDIQRALDELDAQAEQPNLSERFHHARLNVISEIERRTGRLIQLPYSVYDLIMQIHDPIPSDWFRDHWNDSAWRALDSKATALGLLYSLLTIARGEDRALSLVEGALGLGDDRVMEGHATTRGLRALRRDRREHIARVIVSAQTPVVESLWDACRQNLTGTPMGSEAVLVNSRRFIR